MADGPVDHRFVAGQQLVVESAERVCRRGHHALLCQEGLQEQFQCFDAELVRGLNATIPDMPPVPEIPRMAARTNLAFARAFAAKPSGVATAGPAPASRSLHGLRCGCGVPRCPYGEREST